MYRTHTMGFEATVDGDVAPFSPHGEQSGHADLYVGAGRSVLVTVTNLLSVVCFLTASEKLTDGGTLPPERRLEPGQSTTYEIGPKVVRMTFTLYQGPNPHKLYVHIDRSVIAPETLATA